MEKDKENKQKTTVEIIESGPLKISGNFILKDLQRDNETVAGEVLLCRCGKSLKMPLCDDSHKNK